MSAALDARFVVETGPAAEIAALAEPVLVDLGFRLVRVVISGRNGTTVQIMAERPDGAITVEDCATISRQLSVLLDVSNPLPGAYTLEVSSPGIDRPLVRPGDFQHWCGYEAKIEMREPIDGRKRFRGVLLGLKADAVQIGVDLGPLGRQEIDLPIAGVAEARLVLTEGLIRETLRRAKKAALEPPAAGAGEERFVRGWRGPSYGASRCKRKSLGTGADRRRGGARKDHRSPHRHCGDGGCDPEGGQVALRQRERYSLRDRCEDGRDQAHPRAAGGRGRRQ